MAKRILVYTNHFYPEQFKVNEIVDWLSKEDTHIRVITGIPNYPKGRFYKGYGFFSIFNNKYKNNVVVNRMPLIPRGNGNYFLRTLNYITYFISTFFFTIYLIIFKEKYEVIFVHHTSPILVAIHPIIYGFFYKTRKYLWNLDLWPDTLKAMGLVKLKLIYELIEMSVFFIYSFYDKILIGSKSFKMSIESRYSGEVLYFPNWADEIIEKNTFYNNVDIQVPDDHFVIMYTGNIGIAQGFDRLHHTIKKLINQKVFWIFIGDGSYKKIFKKNIEKNNTNNKCLFIDQISVDMIPSYVRLADALFLSLKCNDLFSKTVPAKLQTYMSLSKPIIANIQGESADIIKQSRTGFIDETKDQSNLADIIKQIINMDQNELDFLGKRANKFYEKNYHSKLRKSQLLELFI